MHINHLIINRPKNCMHVQFSENFKHVKSACKYIHMKVLWLLFIMLFRFYDNDIALLVFPYSKYVYCIEFVCHQYAILEQKLP